MAILYAQADGNASEIAWNTAANGSGSSAPWGDHLETDTLEANLFTVNLDPASVVRAAIQTLNGGRWNVDLAAVGNREFVFDVTAGSTACLVFANGTYTCSLIGDVTAGSAANARGIYTPGISLLDIDGNVTGGSASGAYGVYQAAANAVVGTRIRRTTTGGSSTSGSYGAFNESNAPMDLFDVGGGPVAHGGCAGANAYRASGRTAELIVRGILDFTTAAAPITVPFHAHPSARIKVLASDGVTPIYFRPEVARHFGGNIARAN